MALTLSPVKAASEFAIDRMGQSIASALAQLTSPQRPAAEAEAAPATPATPASDAGAELASPSSATKEWPGIFVKRRRRGFSQDETPLKSPEAATPVQPSAPPPLALEEAANACRALAFDAGAQPNEAAEPVAEPESTDQAAAAVVSADLPVEPELVLLPPELAPFRVAEFSFGASGEEPTKHWSDCCDELGSVSPVSGNRGADSSWSAVAGRTMPAPRRRPAAPAVPVGLLHGAAPAPVEKTAVFIGSLKHYMNEKWVGRYFRGHGVGQVLGAGSGFAVVEVPADQAVAFIARFDGFRLDGKKLTVRASNKPAATDPPAPPAPAVCTSPGRS